MADEVRLHGQAAQLEPAARGVMQHQATARKIANAHGEERRREITGQSVVERHRRRGRAPDVHLHRRIEERREEAEPLQVVHVEVREQDIEPPQSGINRRRSIADSRAGVKQNHGAVVRGDFDGGCVPSVRHHARPDVRE